MAKQLGHRRSVRWWIGVGSVLAVGCTSASHGQILVDLTINGPSTVVENSETQYWATARFDDNSEFDATIFCDWSVKPDTFASIDSFGRLTTVEVAENEPIIVSASFTWDDVTLDDAMDVMIFDVPSDDGDDPWPFWGRTPGRLGNTMTIGPRTPTIEWSIQITDYQFEVVLEASPVMDSEGRIFIGHVTGVTAVDSSSREVLWDITGVNNPRGVAVWNGRVVWGDFSPFSTLYCHDAETGDEIWTFQAENAISAAPVVSPTGIVYITSQTDADFQHGIVYARDIKDGSEVWTFDLGDLTYNSPSLQWPTHLISAGTPTAFDLISLNPVTGDPQWTFETDQALRGTSAIVDGRVYVASWDRYLYCVDAETGEELWRFWCEQSNQSSIAVGHDGTVYTVTHGNVGLLFAISPDGEEVWRYELPGLSLNAPIVGGDGTIYVCSTHYGQPEIEGWVNAMRPDGTVLWARQLPELVGASPMLAPDGTLYIVCSDKNLYAFRDPARVAALTDLSIAWGTLLEGDLSRLIDSDDIHLVTTSRFGFNASEPNVTELVVGAVNDLPDPAALDVTIETRINHPAGTQKVRLRNWADGSFDEIDIHAIGPLEDAHHIYSITPDEYIREADGRMELSIRQIVMAVFSASGFRSSFDQVELELR